MISGDSDQNPEPAVFTVGQRGSAQFLRRGLDLPGPVLELIGGEFNRDRVEHRGDREILFRSPLEGILEAGEIHVAGGRWG